MSGRGHPVAEAAERAKARETAAIYERGDCEAVLAQAIADGKITASGAAGWREEWRTKGSVATRKLLASLASTNVAHGSQR